MSHSSYEVAVGSGYGALVFGKYAHITAEAGSARRGGNYRARFNEYFNKPFAYGLQINFVGGGYDYRTDVLCNLSAI